MEPPPLPESDVPQRFIGPVVQGSAIWPNTDWWNNFHDAELSAFIEEVKANNLDLANNAGDVTADVNYLELPLFVRFDRSLNDTLRGFAMAGPAFSVKVGTGATLDGVQGTSDFDIDPAIGSRDFGLAFAGGLEWQKFLVEARYVLGLTDIATDIYFHEDPLRNRSFSIMVGLRLP